MKTKKKAKSHAKRPQARRSPETFTPMETGQPDQDRVPGSDNPLGAQGGLGPLNEEGEGGPLLIGSSGGPCLAPPHARLDRQNDELAELEQIKPDL